MADTRPRKKIFFLKKLVGAGPYSHIKTCRHSWNQNKPVKNYTNSLQDKSSAHIDKYTVLQTCKHGNVNILGHPWTHSQALLLIPNKQTQAEVDSR